jgi:uncharacterized protein YbjQ (UPF0145 family)
MKSKDLARSNGLDPQWFDHWINQSKYRFKTGVLGGIDLEEGQNFEEMVYEFRAWAEEQRKAAEQAQAEEQAAMQEKHKALAGILITSGFNFDGHTITKYSGYISGDDVVQIPRGQGGFWNGGATDVGAALMNSLVGLRRNALNELKEAALALGCNAVIGVDFDYLTLDPETVNSQGGTLYMPYVFGVTANGNAVVIEENRPSA